MNADHADGADRYLRLLKRTLTRLVAPSDLRELAPTPGTYAAFLLDELRAALDDPHADLVRRVPFDRARREVGRDWPADAETMVGLRRLDDLQDCVERALADDVPGDLLEAGVWRGGAAILMRAVLEAHGDAERLVWVADSFAGLPPPEPDRYPEDEGDEHHLRPELAIPRSEVEDAFRRYELLDDRVRFLEGWFEDTLPSAPIEALAVLRLDGDMYSSTIQALDALYDKVSPGGFVIIDDYGAIAQCRAAVTDFREARGITAELRQVDWTGVHWRKP